MKGFSACRRCKHLFPMRKIINRICKDCREKKAPCLCASCGKPFEKLYADTTLCESCKLAKQIMTGYVNAKPHRCECGEKITTKDCVKCSTLKWMEMKKVSS